MATLPTNQEGKLGEIKCHTGYIYRDDKRISIVQKHKEMLDMVQAIFLRTGRSCILSQRANKQWTAFVSNCTTRHFRNATSSLVRDDYAYHGIVWCPNVDNGTWVARRGGRPFITGNTFPRSLIAPLIKAATPRQCCPVCGAGWAAVVERHETGEILADGSIKETKMSRRRFVPGSEYTSETSVFNTGKWNGSTVLSYHPTCDHNANPIPGLVLDPFVGSGTTLIEARTQGLHAIGCDLSYDYLHNQARSR